MKEENIDNWIELKENWEKLHTLNQIVFSKVVTLASLLHLISAIAQKNHCNLKSSKKREDLRLHMVWMIDSRAGKGELQRMIYLIFERLGMNYQNPTEISDARLLGSTDAKGKIIEGLLKTSEHITLDEFEIYFNQKDWSSNIFSIIRKNCDTYGTPSNRLHNDKLKNVGLEPFYGKSTLLLTSYPIDEKISPILTSGTFQRCLFIVEKVEQEKSDKIFDGMKIVKQNKKEIEKLDEERKIIANRITEILNFIPQRKLIYLNNDYYNDIVEFVKNEVNKWYNDDEEKGRKVRSYYMSVLLHIQKISAIIALIRGKEVIDKEDLIEAYDLVKEIYDNLIYNSDLFSTTPKEKLQWINDCRRVLGNDWNNSTDIMVKMGKFWEIKSSVSIIRRLKLISMVFLEKRDGNTKFRKIK